MSLFRNILTAGILTTVATNGAFAQVVTPEVEPNGDKVEATVVLGMTMGDSITGASTGTITGAGNSAADTADYWDISTAPQPTAGWYRWTLTMTTGNDLQIRGLNSTGTVGTGSIPNVGSDIFVQSDVNLELHWYSNEGASRISILVDGSGTSPTAYTATLSSTPIASTMVNGGFAAGMITVTTVGQTSDDTDISIADSTRTVIPGFQNDDGIVMPGVQSELTRMYTAGSYYLVITDFDQATSQGAAADDDFIGGVVMDFPNTYANSRGGTGEDLTFLIDDGQGNMVVTVATKQLVHGLEFYEFVVGGAGGSGICNGDGGNQMGCTNCPCGNEAPQGTVGGCLNSAGTSAQLQSSGSASVSLPSGSTTDLRFAISGAPGNAFCILNSGDAVAPGNAANPCFGMNSGAQAAPFDGLRCAIMNTRRHGGRSADGNGDVGVTNNPWGGEGGPPVGIAVAGGGFASGQTRYFQVINRDDAMAVCMRGLNTSQAIMVTFTP